MKRNQFSILISMILIICCLTTCVFAENIEELINKQNEVKNQMDEANKQLDDVQENLSDMMLQIQELNETILNYELETANLEIQMSNLKENIEQIENKLTTAEKIYNEQKKVLDTRLTVIYETGEISYLDLLLNSVSLSDFLSNYYLITEITRYDNELLEEMEKSKENVRIAKETLEQKKEALKIIKDNKEKTTIALENSRFLKDQYVQQLSEEEKVLQEKVEKYQEEIKQIETEIIIVTTANLDSEYTGGIMAWPVPGYTRITSSFGMRVHPITGIYKLHTGVDIGGAPIGARFVAANDGVVIKASYNNAYGNMVIIDHGGGVSTLYAHGSEILVSVGQTVKRGETVLKVGSTGYSTGPHAHFEVRVNGQYVDPIKYITSSNEQEQ